MHDRIGTFARLAFVAVIVATSTACSTNPATGRSQALMYNRGEEIQIGEEHKGPLTEEFGGAITQPALHNYVSDIGKRLAAVTESDFPSLPWEFTLLNSKVINAFALPGGKVFISRGLCEEMTNEAQLAAVLGHEVGHVTGRHTSERMSQALGSTIGGAIIGGLIGAAAGGKEGAAAGVAGGATIGGIVSLSFSREQEIEADRLGMRYMERLGYDPVGAIEVQEILGRAGGGGTPEFLSTHPASATRIAELNKRYDKYYAHTRGNPNYQKHAERFQPFLAGLRVLPAPRAHAEPRPRTPEGARALMFAAAFHAGQSGDHSAFGPLGDPVNWCWHCAVAAAGEAD
ncbi:MAG: M48 family metalloprotease [Phycisphaeraceae bacterium]|nr:M48 family metalloprotease [Phycisphaeraceae bacterium]